jgi:hypothetical protein
LTGSVGRLVNAAAHGCTANHLDQLTVDHSAAVFVSDARSRASWA